MSKRLISEDIKIELKSINISEVCDKLGVNHTGDCPTGHDSIHHNCFHIFPESNSYYCFNCTTGGDTISLVQMIHNCNFTEACQYLITNFRPDLLNNMNSITPEEMQKIQADREKAEQVYQAMNQATEYYYNKLLGNPEAMAYLKGRGLTEDFIRSNPYVKFGFAPLNQNDLCNYLVSRFG